MLTKTGKLIFIYCLVTMLLTGCWDRVEIEQRGFVVGFAVDLANDDVSERKGPILTLTNQFVVPSGLSSSSQGGGGNKKAFENISASGESMFAINREMSTMTSRTPFVSHLKIIVVSEEVAEKPNLFGNILDVFIRDHEMRRGVKVIISEGSAKGIIELTTEMEELPIMFIESVIENTHKSAGTVEPVQIGDVHAFLLGESSFALPKIASTNNLIQNMGVAVFQGNNNQMVGTLNGNETKGLNFIRGKFKSGNVKTEVNGQLVTFEIVDAKSTIKVNIGDGPSLDFSISVVVEGNVAETFGSKSQLIEKNIEEIEQNVSKEIEQIVNQTIVKVHDELQVDIFGFDDLLKRKHYDTWKNIKEDWDYGENHFAKSSINVSANAIIRSSGSSDQTKK